MGFLRIFLALLINATSTLLIIYCILSWFMAPDHPVRQLLGSIIDPILDPIRSITPGVGMVDFSPIILMLILQFLQNVINRL
ncbi:MAG: YggT family protein [Flexilinea sp.]|nr:YggT family protein [Flexilinea sp.]